MRVAVADDALLVREGLARILSALGIEVTVSAADIDELLHAVDRDPPDVAILDIRMPPGYSSEGLRAAAQLAVTHPQVGVLVLSQYREPSYAAALLATSVTRRGLPAQRARILYPDQLASALYRITAGEIVVDSAVIDDALGSAGANDRLTALSARELEVLRLLAQGLTDRGICDQLTLSPRTVASHVQHIFTKLALPDSDHDNRRVHAVLAYLDHRGYRSLSASP